MKIQIISRSTDATSVPAAHKPGAGRNHNAKTLGHRYERRKVRELLRHGIEADDRLLTIAPIS